MRLVTPSRVLLFLTAAFCTLPLARAADDDGLVVGIVRWEAGEQPDATAWDKTDYWSAIAISPSTGKYGASCYWTERANSTRQSRENCNEKDARCVILCCNGWCALALGKRVPGKDVEWAVGWAAEQADAERWALQSAKQRNLVEPKVVYSIYARTGTNSGAIAYSKSTGDFGYASGSARTVGNSALKYCKQRDAAVLAVHNDYFLALATGDDKSTPGVGHAGNRADAEAMALEQCNKQTKNAKVVASFATTGFEH
jgi:hypothetical protein